MQTSTCRLCLLAAVMGLASPWLGAQNAPAAPGADQTVPLPGRINRNPAYRERLPQAPPSKPDPRDSSVRPVQPPASAPSLPGNGLKRP